MITQPARWRSVFDGSVLAVLSSSDDIVGFIMRSGAFVVGAPRIGAYRTFLDIESAAAYVETFLPAPAREPITSIEGRAA